VEFNGTINGEQVILAICVILRLNDILISILEHAYYT